MLSPHVLTIHPSQTVRLSPQPNIPEQREVLAHWLEPSGARVEQRLELLDQPGRFEHIDSRPDTIVLAGSRPATLLGREKIAAAARHLRAFARGAMSSAAAQGGAREPVVLYACGSFNPITNLHLRIFGELLLCAGRSSLSLVREVTLRYTSAATASQGRHHVPWPSESAATHNCS